MLITMENSSTWKHDFSKQLLNILLLFKTDLWQLYIGTELDIKEDAEC